MSSPAPTSPTVPTRTSGGAEGAIEVRIEEEHSPEVLEILGEVPPMLVRRGMMAVFVAVATMLLASWVIRYPELISARITLVSAIAGEIELPSDRLHRVEVGQRVVIELDRYPAHEFGIVEGRVVAILPPTRDRRYRVEVGLPAGLESRQRQPLALTRNMQGDAEIVVREQRLLERILARPDR